MADFERRFLAFPAEPRAGGASAPRRLAGVAARYNSVAEIGGRFSEKIAPGAFAASLAAGGDILALFDHDPARVLGRTRNKTLRLADGPAALEFEIDAPDTTAGRDALALAQRGDLGGASIGFIAREESREDGVRVIQRAELLEISVVSAWPAYADTLVEARQIGRSFVGPAGRGSRASPAPRLDALRRYLETL